MYYVLVDIGCIECSEESHVVGIFTDKSIAEEAQGDHDYRQVENWNGQHRFSIFEIEELDHVYRVDYDA